MTKPANPDLLASRAAARQRVRAAMQHVEAAQNELMLASADLSAIYGFSPVHDAVYKLSAKVSRSQQRPDTRSASAGGRASRSRTSSKCGGSATSVIKPAVAVSATAT